MGCPPPYCGEVSPLQTVFDFLVFSAYFGAFFGPSDERTVDNKFQVKTINKFLTYPGGPG